MAASKDGLSSERSSDCFGVVTVNPWNAMMFNIGVIGCLLVFRPRKRVMKGAYFMGKYSMIDETTDRYSTNFLEDGRVEISILIGQFSAVPP